MTSEQWNRKVDDEIAKNAKHFQDRLGQLIAESGKGQHKIAEGVGISQAAISKLLNGNGKNGPNFDTLSRLSFYFDVSFDYLMGCTEVPNADTLDMEVAKKYGLEASALNALQTWSGFHGHPVAGPTPHDCELALHGVNLLFETMPMDFFISISRYYNHYFNKPLPYETDSELYDNYELTPDILDSSILLRIQKYFMDGRDWSDQQRDKFTFEKAKREEKRRQQQEK